MVKELKLTIVIVSTLIALGLLAVVTVPIVDSLTLIKEADAQGCPTTSLAFNASKGRCFRGGFDVTQGSELNIPEPGGPSSIGGGGPSGYGGSGGGPSGYGGSGGGPSGYGGSGGGPLGLGGNPQR